MQDMKEMILKLHQEILELKVTQLISLLHTLKILFVVSMFGDEIEKITILDHVSLKEKRKLIK